MPNAAIRTKEARVTTLRRIALADPRMRDEEALIIYGMGHFGVYRDLAKKYAQVALAGIEAKGDLYGVSPELGNSAKSADDKNPTYVVGAGMTDPSDLKPLTPEEEKAIRDTPLTEILTHVDRTVPKTDFKVVEEKD